MNGTRAAIAAAALATAGVVGLVANRSSAPTYTRPCVRAPLDGGTDCLRNDGISGPRFFGTGNVFPASQATGSNCEQVECTVVYGEDPDETL